MYHDIIIIYTFFGLQMQYLYKDLKPLPKRPKELAGIFMSSLEKLSASRSGKTIIVIDNVDLIMVCSELIKVTRSRGNAGSAFICNYH